MRAVMFHDVHDIRCKVDWLEPTAGPGEVKTVTSWCGICRTDMDDYERGAVIPIDEPQPLSSEQAPLVIDHEFSGRIAELGPARVA